jgi:WD40 repeat protein
MKTSLIVTNSLLELDKDPTLSFRLAEYAYLQDTNNLLAQKALISAFHNRPFYSRVYDNYLNRYYEPLSPDGKKIILDTEIGSLKVIDFSGYEINTSKKMHKGYFHATFFNDSKRVMTCGTDRLIKTWNFSDGEYKLIRHNKTQFGYCIVSPNGQYFIISLGIPYTYKLCDIGGTELYEFSIEDEWFYDSPIFSYDSKCLFIKKNDSIIGEFDIRQKIFIDEFKSSFYISSFDLSKDKKYLICSGENNNAILWNIKTKKISLIKVNSDQIEIARFVPKNNKILTITDEQIIQLWSINGEQLDIYYFDDYVNYVNFSDDGEYFIIGTDNNSTTICNIETGREKILKGHIVDIEYYNFSNDMQYVIKKSEKDTRVWRFIEDSLILSSNDDYIYLANFLNGGEVIVTGGEDTLRIWRNNIEIFKFEAHKWLYK